MADPIQVTVVGTGTATQLESKTVAVTPGRSPNLITNVVSPLVAIAVRFGHDFFVALSGSFGVDTLGSAMGTPVFVGHEQMLWAAFGVAMGGLVKNLVTIFGKLENKFPLWTGNV